MDKRTRIAIGTIIGLVIINLILVVYLLISKANQPKIVSFDMKGTVDLFLLQMKNNNLSEEQINIATIKFNNSLDESIQTYAYDNNVLILVKPAVVAGIDDVTEDIQYLISDKMAN